MHGMSLEDDLNLYCYYAECYSARHALNGRFEGGEPVIATNAHYDYIMKDLN